MEKANPLDCSDVVGCSRLVQFWIPCVWLCILDEEEPFSFATG